MDIRNIEQVFQDVNDHHLLHDLAVIRPDQVTPVWREYDKAYSAKPLPFVKSIIVYVVFTPVAGDYYFRDELTPRLIRALNAAFGSHFRYDHYCMNRKQLAVLAGLGKIAKSSLVYSRKFGLNCKIDAIVTDLEFDHYAEYDGHMRHPECADCAGPCVSRCPVACRMDYHLYDIPACDHHITPHLNAPERMCRSCIEACKPSQDLLATIPDDHHRRIGKPAT